MLNAILVKGKTTQVEKNKSDGIASCGKFLRNLLFDFHKKNRCFVKLTFNGKLNINKTKLSILS